MSSIVAMYTTKFLKINLNIQLPEYTILADFGQSLLPQRVYTTPPEPPESPFSPCSPLCPGGPCFPGAPEGLVN